MELLNLIGEGAQIGDMNAEDVAALSGRQAFSLLLPDGRVVVLIGLTSEEARGCLPGFMAPARFTVSAAGCLTCIEQSVQGLQCTESPENRSSSKPDSVQHSARARPTAWRLQHPTTRRCCLICG